MASYNRRDRNPPRDPYQDHHAERHDSSTRNMYDDHHDVDRQRGHMPHRRSPPYEPKADIRIAAGRIARIEDTMMVHGTVAATTAEAHPLGARIGTDIAIAIARVTVLLIATTAAGAGVGVGAAAEVAVEAAMIEEAALHHIAYGRASAFARLQILEELARIHDTSVIENVRVIRDKSTRQPRGFGFLRFSGIDTAKAFYEQNYPMFDLSYRQANGDTQIAQIRVAYSREREERSKGERAEGDWTCRICNFANFSGRKICFKCHTAGEISTGGGMASKPVEFTNNGDSDVTQNGSPSQYLLLRSLEPTVNEDLLAKGVAKLYKPTVQVSDTPSKPSKKGPAKVASTTGDANLGAKDGSIRRILLVRDRQTNESWRYGFAEFITVEDAQAALTRFNSFDKFTIASKPVHITFIHAGVFVPIVDDSVRSEEVSFASSLNPSIRLQYWDEAAYVSELVVNEVQDVPLSVGQAASAAATAAAAAEKEGFAAPDDEGDGKNRKRKADPKSTDKVKKTAPAHLQFWSDRHAELHGLPPKQETETNTDALDTGEPEEPVASTDSQQSYANLSKMCCYLCSRQFKTESEVNKHERLSQLHQSNLQKEDLKAKAMAKLAKAGITPITVRAADTEYRDRAKERRQAFGSARIQLPMKKSQTEATAAKEDATPAAPSKGASLLGKMGWSEGQGLGAQGTGMTAPINTEVYAAGVGLGASGGKLGDAAEEAQRNTKGSYANFVERAKDKAKERFQQMSK